MKNLIVTLSHLENVVNGNICSAAVSFKAIQSGRVIVEDTVSGKVSNQFRKSYRVEATTDEIIIQHNRSDLPDLLITAELH